MKKLFFIVPLILALSMLFTACGGNENYEIKACTLTTFTAEDMDGNIIDESVFEGTKVTMVNLWGTYCSPCKEEVPALNELFTEYENSDFQIIGIPVDRNHDSAADAREVIAELGATYKNIKISNSIKSFVESAPTLPYTIFVNAEGCQIGEAYSGAKTKKEWKKIIDGMIKFVNSNS